MIIALGILFIIISIVIFGDYNSYKNTGSPSRVIYYEYGSIIVLLCIILFLGGIYLLSI